ncbi:MAG: neuraminidase-like domain-containing protein, partial [Vicinamibacterales bacterium]
MANQQEGKAKAKSAAAKKGATRGDKGPASGGSARLVDSGEEYVVSGTATYPDSTPASGLTVIAHDTDDSGEHALGQSATTDDGGSYTIIYSDADFRRSDKERRGANVIVRVYDRDNNLLFTSKTNYEAPAEYRLDITVQVAPYVIRGTVKDANQKPLANVTVRAFERDLRHRQPIGTAETGSNGEFRIEYHPADFELGDVPSRPAPWLIVEIHETPNGAALARQEVRKAARDQTVSFTLANVGAVSEMQRIGEAVLPRLKGQDLVRVEVASHANAQQTRGDLAPWDVTAADIDFIARDSELDRAAVEAWVASSRMARDAELQLTVEHSEQQALLRDSGWPFFYAMVRQGVATDLTGVLREPSAKWRQAWTSARALNRVPALGEARVELLEQALGLLLRLQQIDRQRGGDNALATILDGLSNPLPRVIALEALAIVQEKGLDDPDALLVMSERHPDAGGPIQSFVRAVRVHQLASGHEGLSRALNARLEGSASDSIAPLAAMMSADWIGVAKEASTSPGQALRLLAQVETQHPLAALEAKVIAGNVTLPEVSGAQVGALIKNDGATVEKILQGKLRVKDGDAKVPVAHKTLRDLGRFMRTGVSMELAADLMNADIGTPGKALRYGSESIYEQHRKRLPKDTARDIADNFIHAAELHVDGGKGVMLDVEVNRRSPSRGWQDVEEYTLPLPEGVRENLPSLPGFFGDLDECLCKPCESMLGQPAYLVDLLNLLGKNLHWLLKQRRPGIFTLQLTCENADPDNPIQHIDIVLEVLENAVGANPYQTTANSAFPWRLPFNRPYAETRAYLAKLGVSRFDLLSLRSGQHVNEVAAETLNVTFPQQWPLSEWRLLTEKRTGADLWRAYGLGSLGGGSFPFVDPASGENLDRHTRDEVVARASVLIEITGLELDDLEKVLATRFVSGFEGELRLSDRNQCKTSEMHVLAKGAGDVLRPLVDLHACLDRLHRFTRLLAKLPGWSITQLDKAIALCGGIEMEVLVTPQDREGVLVKLAIIKRLHDHHGIPLDYLLDQPMSAANLRASLGLSTLQFELWKTLTAFDPTPTQSFNWAALEEFCKALKRARESGLSAEQVAQALLTRAQLSGLFGVLPQAIKTDGQIVELLKNIQLRLRSVVAVRPDVAPEAQAREALTTIFDAATAHTLVETIRDAGATPPVAPTTTLLNELVGKLSVPTTTTRLDGWLPLMADPEARALLAVTTTNLPGNPDALTRFTRLLNAIATRRRERELIAVIAGQSGLSEPEVISLLGSGLWLAPPAAQGQDPASLASTAFLAPSFLGDVPSSDPPRVERSDFPLLHAWMDRLYRMITLGAALTLDRDMLQLTRDITVGSSTGINWHDLLATEPASGGAWSSPQWQALLDLAWLQQPEQLSRPTLSELLSRLTTLALSGAQTVTTAALRPLATRLAITDTQALAIAGQAVTVTTDNLRDPRKLRRVFELLMLARRLGANDTQITQIADGADIAQAVTTAKALLEARISEQEHKDDWRAINDKLRQQRRDALVAYLVGNVRLEARNYTSFRNANDLYEYYLIDPQMEPCFETTRILEAITATQLFAQRLLFGLERGQVASRELKDRWTWMRNYRVWEANRKVFLFPENWLFPELRDDKSSSFKQLESALGQGELNQELAVQSFGQFLDDVAQIGQTHVLGMFEHLHEQNRSLYVVGRSANPPYHYYWRQCLDLGGASMEWTPWQRIELDIEGDHVLPFVLHEELYIAWPLIQRITGTDIRPDQWQIQLAWARYNGSAWKKQILSRDKRAVDVASFSDHRIGFSLRYEPSTAGLPRIAVYYQADVAGNVTTAPVPPVVPDPQPPLVLGTEFNEPTRLAELILTNPSNFPAEYRGTLRLYALKLKYQDLDPEYEIGSKDWWRLLDFLTMDKTLSYQGQQVEYFNFDAVAYADSYILPRRAKIVEPTWPEQVGLIRDFLAYFKSKNLITINRTSAWDEFVAAITAKTSRITIKCRTWINLRYEDGQTGLKEVSTPNQKFSAQIGSAYIPLKPFKPGDPNGPGVAHNILRFGQIGAQQVSMTYTEQFPDKVLPTVTLATVAVGESKSVDQTLHFVLDGTAFYALELGFSLDDDAVLNQRVIFHVAPEESVLSEAGDGSPLVPWARNSRPWMNGFQEKYKQVDESFRLNTTASGEISILPSSSNQFWVAGAPSSAAAPAWPQVLYYRDGVSSLFIDIAALPSASGAGLRALPDSYQSAIQRKLHWATNHMTWPDLPSQLDEFGAINLGASSPIDSDKYSEVRLGELAFDSRLPYARYNWEVFLHAPLLIADQLSKQHKFEDAERWLRYVFDPTSGGPETDADRFLKFKVFKKLVLSNQVIDDLTALAQVAGGLGTPTDADAVHTLINRWRDAPFRPFQIARGRHIAFLWRTLFAYLDNLIAWADSLYRRDTRESINEATMLYVLAERILGRRPRQHDGESKRASVSYEDVISKWDDFANYWIDVGTSVRGNRPTAWRDKDSIKQPNPDGMLYFCMPFNDKILSYWNVVEVRLANVRNCRNIEGIRRSLPLMDAPIDPELLVRATAAGLDLSDVIAGLYAPPPHYRYNTLSARALELVNETRALGGAMLSAIEKRDAEHLAQLRSSNEISLLRLVNEVRELQISEAERNIEALRAGRTSVATRYNQYQRLLGKQDAVAPDEGNSAGEESMLGNQADGASSQASALGLIGSEDSQVTSLDTAKLWSDADSISRVVASVFHLSASAVHYVPNPLPTKVGEALTALGTSSSTLGDAFRAISQLHQNEASHHSLMATHLRRRDDWAFQSNQALRELQHVDRQILANQIRIDITKKELINHLEQIEQANAVDEVMRSKFSNEQLYEWMRTQLYSLYSSAYRMALEMARRAERAAARELGVKPLNILRNDYWDSMRDGLLAGERLHQDIKRLEVTYLDQNRREFELTKHISLRRLNPTQLVTLRAANTVDGKKYNRCEFDIPEWLFDLDTPGHYLRRIKSVSVSIPSVVGPYTSVNCTLTLLKSSVRHDSNRQPYLRPSTADDPSFTDYFGASESIVTSTG